jgi:hypothetical protein
MTIFDVFASEDGRTWRQFAMLDAADIRKWLHANPGKAYGFDILAKHPNGRPVTGAELSDEIGR